LGSQEKLAVRLLAWQLPEERVAQRRRKVHQAAQKSTPSRAEKRAGGEF